MATDPSSIANLYQDQEEIAKCFGRIIYNVVKHAKNFRYEDFENYDLNLCEAFCLLWQNAETGQVDGRLMGFPLKISVFAALFIDLVVTKRVEVYKEHDEEPMFRVIGNRSNDTFLDIAIFDQMRAAHSHGRLRDAKLWKWLERADDKELVEITFDSLVARKILKEKHSGILGMFKRFPTLDPEPEKRLEAKIKNIAFKKEDLDSYMLALLILARESDRIFMCKDPILRKHFTCSEYHQAKLNIDKILLEHLDYNASSS